MILIVLPTLDGSTEAAVDRLEAWRFQPARRQAVERIRTGMSRYATLGDRFDRLDRIPGVSL